MEEEILDLLNEWVKWEADWIMNNELWDNPVPKLNQELIDRYNILQEKRNKILDN